MWASSSLLSCRRALLSSSSAAARGRASSFTSGGGAAAVAASTESGSAAAAAAPTGCWTTTLATRVNRPASRGSSAPVRTLSMGIPTTITTRSHDDGHIAFPCWEHHPWIGTTKTTTTNATKTTPNCDHHPCLPLSEIAPASSSLSTCLMTILTSQPSFPVVLPPPPEVATIPTNVDGQRQIELPFINVTGDPLGYPWMVVDRDDVDNNLQHQQHREAMLMSSTLKKRRAKMNKHKLKKRRKLLRLKSK